MLIFLLASTTGEKAVEKLHDTGSKENVSISEILLGDLQNMQFLSPENLRPLLLEVQETKSLPEKYLDMVPGTKLL
jgi:hypothetical protein